MLHNESLSPPFQGAVGVGHDIVARQCREVREESRVDQRGKREALKEGKSKMHQCIHREMGAHWGGASAKIYFTSDALAPRPDVSDAIPCVPCVPHILT